MATHINVVADSALLQRAKDEQAARRLAFLEGQQRKNLANDIEAKQATAQGGKADKGLPLSKYQRDPAAFRRTGDLVGIAITWRGNRTGGETKAIRHILSTATVPGVPNPVQRILDVTYTNPAFLSPSPLRIATRDVLLSFDQSPRTGEWSSLTKGSFSGYTGTTFHPGWYLEQIRIDASSPWQAVDLAPAPAGSLVGPTSYMPSFSLLTVAPDGTVFLVIELPAKPVGFTSALDTRTIFYGNTYDTWIGQGRFLAKTATQDPLYLFAKIKGASIQSKTIAKASAVDMKRFLADNLYQDDPSISVRALGYLGEYRLKGQTASILRLNRKASSHLSFPFDFLTAYKADDVALPVLKDGDAFEDHVYQLSSWSTPQELYNQLIGLVPPGSSGTSPDRVLKVSMPPGLFNGPRNKLGSDPGSIVTPNLYLPIRV
jgi:hypothetical protein